MMADAMTTDEASEVPYFICHFPRQELLIHAQIEHQLFEQQYSDSLWGPGVAVLHKSDGCV